MTTKCQPPNCPCFCPTADTPVAPIMVPQGGPGEVIDIPIYGTQGFSVSVVTNPTYQPSGTPVIALVQMHSGNIVRVTTGSPGLADTITGYDALIRVCNACGTLDIPIRIDVVADLNPVVTNCLLAQALWTPEARVPTVGDTLLAFTPAGCRALLPPLLPDTCGDIQAFPPVVATLGTQLATADCGLATVSDVLALIDFCAPLQAFPVAMPGPLDTVYGQQAGVCSQFTIFDIAASVDICVLLQNLPNAVVQPTAVFYGQQGGSCFEFAVSDLLALAAPDCPYLAPCDGSCAAPAYSFASQPTSGMWMNGAILTLSANNCTDFIEIGNSVDINAATSFVRLRGGYLAPGSACGLIVETNNIERLRIGSNGAWNLGGGGGGSVGQVITSNGSGTPPTWQAAGGAAFPLLAPDGSCAAPSYSFSSSPDSGMFYTGTAVRISDDNCGDYIEVGASINIIGANGLFPVAPSNVTIKAGDLDTGFGFGGNLVVSAGDTIGLSTGFAGGLTLRAGDGISANSDRAGIAIVRGGDQVGGSNQGCGPITVRGGDITTVAVPNTVAGITTVRGGDNTISANGRGGVLDLRGGQGQNAALGGAIAFTTGAIQRMRLLGTGALEVGGSEGLAGQRLTSQGPGLPPIWV